MSEKQQVTSKDIKIALKGKHLDNRSFFITECKTCSSYFPDPQGLLIFDGLAITKSYTQPCIIGYEIKVSRSDFLQDNKWHLYLQYCNEFFFVCPKGLIKKDELPEGVGLIYYDPNAKRMLNTVKKALYRQIEEPVGVYKYIIYSRLEEDRFPFFEERAEYAEDYLADRAYKKNVGLKLGSKLAQDLQIALERLDRLSNVENEIKKWDEVKKVLGKHNFLLWGDWIDDLDRALSGVAKKTDICFLERELESVLRTVKRIKGDQENAN